MFDRTKYVDRVTVPEWTTLIAVSAAAGVGGMAVSEAVHASSVSSSVNSNLATLENEKIYLTFDLDNTKSSKAATSLKADIAQLNHSISVDQARLHSGNYDSSTSAVSGGVAMLIGASVVLAAMNFRRWRYRRLARDVMNDAETTVWQAELDSSQ